jgi:VWFA-related protein
MVKQLLILLFGAFFPLTQDAPEVQIYTAAWFPPNPTISADANLVELAATVRDRHEHLIGGLRAGDFEVLDNKQPQEITFFEERRSGRAAPAAGATTLVKDTPPLRDPRTIALFFDDAHANDLGIRKSAEAAEKLIRNDLHSDDRAGIFSASGMVSIDFTNDRDALLSALGRLIPRPLSGTTAISECPELNAWEAYAIIEHVDAAIELGKMQQAAACVCPPPVTFECRNAQRIPVQNKAGMVWALSKFRSTTTLDAIGIVIRHLAAEPGSRILVLMTPAFPAEKGMESQTSALINSALRSNIRVSTMHMPGRGVPSNVARLEFMGQAATATGGRYVDGYYDPTASLRELVTEPEVSYVLGFSPPGEPDGLIHTLKTLVRGSHGYNVVSRTAYFAAKAPSETAQQRIDRIAMSPEEIKGFSATVALQQDQELLRVQVAIDARSLQFPEKQGLRVQELTVLTVLEDAHGHFVAGKQSVIELALIPATLSEKMRRGIQTATSFPVARPGSYRVREVIREAAQNHIWASGATVEVQ